MFRAACGAAVLAVLAGSVSAGVTPTWSVLTDFMGTSTPTSQTRSLRGLALSHDDSKIFAGFIQGTSSSALRRVDVASGSLELTQSIASSRQPKGVATDDRGWVYASASNPSGDGQFRVYGSDLGSPVTTFTPSGTMRVGGMSVQKFGSDYYLYVAREATSSAYIERYNVTNPLAVTLDTSFGAAGRFDLRTFDAAAVSLTGLEVGADGTIYATDRDINKIYRISANLASVTSATVNRAMDVALYGSNLYISMYDGANSAITVLSQNDLSFVDVLSTGISRANIADSGYAGIDITADGRIVVADQIYMNSPTNEFRDRILISSPIPAPGTAALIAGGLLVARRRRR